MVFSPWRIQKARFVTTFSIFKPYQACISQVWIWYNPNYFNVLTLSIVKKAAIFAKCMQNGIPYTHYSENMWLRCKVKNNSKEWMHASRCLGEIKLIILHFQTTKESYWKWLSHVTPRATLFLEQKNIFRLKWFHKINFSLMFCTSFMFVVNKHWQTNLKHRIHVHEGWAIIMVARELWSQTARSGILALALPSCVPLGKPLTLPMTQFPQL